MCNYLIYGYVGFDKEKFEVDSLEKDIDLVKGKNNFKKVTELKKLYPNVKFLLSVGGFRDLKDEEKYLEVVSTTLPFTSKKRILNIYLKFCTNFSKVFKMYEEHSRSNDAYFFLAFW